MIYSSSPEAEDWQIMIDHDHVNFVHYNNFALSQLWSSGKGKGKESTQEDHSKVIYRL